MGRARERSQNPKDPRDLLHLPLAHPELHLFDHAIVRLDDRDPAVADADRLALARDAAQLREQEARDRLVVLALRQLRSRRPVHLRDGRAPLHAPEARPLLLDERWLALIELVSDLADD